MEQTKSIWTRELLPAGSWADRCVQWLTRGMYWFFCGIFVFWLLSPAIQFWWSADGLEMRSKYPGMGLSIWTVYFLGRQSGKRAARRETEACKTEENAAYSDDATG